MTPRTEGQGAKKQQGIALFQVLVLTTILALLGLTFASEAREKIAQAQALENRVRADFLAHSGLMLGLFLSLAPERAADVAYPCADAPGRGHFNWHNDPLCPTPELRIAIQDLSGLLPLSLPEQPLWAPTLARLGLDEEARTRFLGILRDAQDPDQDSYRVGEREAQALPSGRAYANGPLQRPSFLSALALDSSLLNALGALSHGSGVVEFNPRFAPEVLLKAAYGDAQGRAFATQRGEGNLESGTLQRLAPSFQERELLSFRTSGSNYLRLTLIAEVETARTRREILLQLNPQDQPAFRLLHHLRP
jgi:general secretion pathway protein K